MHLLHTSFQLH
jgi:hypothetical protein